MQVGTRIQINQSRPVGMRSLLEELQYLWKSMETCISKSAMEVEFVALTGTGATAEWLRNLMLDLPIARQHSLAVLVL